MIFWSRRFCQAEGFCLDSNLFEGFSIRGGLERYGIYLDIKGERREGSPNRSNGLVEKIQILNVYNHSYPSRREAQFKLLEMTVSSSFLNSTGVNPSQEDMKRKRFNKLCKRVRNKTEPALVCESISVPF